MSSNNTLYICASGVTTSIGSGVDMVYASIESGISRYEYVDIFEEEDNELQMALVPTVLINQTQSGKPLKGIFTARQERLFWIANSALAQLKPFLPEAPVPIFLAGPDTYVDVPGITSEYFQNFASQLELNIDIESSRTLNTGRAGSIEALELALQYLSFENNHFAIVGGVDSFYDYRVMLHLYQRYRIKRDESFDGFIPGEGSGFLLLASPKAPQNVLELIDYALSTPEKEFEKGHLFGKELYSAESLAKVFTKLLSQDSVLVKDIYSSENGEVHYAKELNVALARNFSSFIEGYEVHRPADCFGDLGAAFGPVALAIGMKKMQVDAQVQKEEFESNEADEQSQMTENVKCRTLVYCSSDSGARGAICINRV